MLEQIISLTAAIAHPSEEEMPLLTALCTAAKAELVRRLREDVAPEDCGSAFPCAAALLAAAGLLPCRSGGNTEQFSVGDVSLRTGSGDWTCEAAAAMRRQAASMMAAYWNDDAFSFQGVKG